MRRLALKALVVLAGVVLAATARAGEPRAPVVVELFTSQGCSACPPADALLAKLAQEDGVLALTMPVDYWDYLGWKDTLAHPAFSARQKAYAKHRGDRAVYTPQAVVGGSVHVVGSKEAALRRAIGEAAAGDEVALALDAEPEALGIRVGAAARGGRAEATVWLVTYEPKVAVRIRSGENEGRRVAYHNVVRRLDAVARWNGKPLALRVDTSGDAGRRCAVLVQEGDRDTPGRILAAAVAKR